VLYFHSAVMMTFNNKQQPCRRSSSHQYAEPEEEDEDAEAVIYTPHGIHSHSEGLDAVTEANPRIKTLAFLHGLEHVTLGPVQQLNLGAHNGLKAQRKLKARYWVSTHDEDKKGTGVVAWLLRRKKLSIDHVVEAERKHMRVNQTMGRLEGVNWVHVGNGESLVLQ
jgi:hypothetical protein